MLCDNIFFLPVIQSAMSLVEFCETTTSQSIVLQTAIRTKC